MRISLPQRKCAHCLIEFPVPANQKYFLLAIADHPPYEQEGRQGEGM